MRRRIAAAASGTVLRHILLAAFALGAAAFVASGCGGPLERASASVGPAAERFAALVKRSDFQAQGPITGTISLGAEGQTVELAMTGGFRMRDGDAAMSTALALEGAEATYDAVYLGAWTYDRSNEDPWRSKRRTEQPDPFFALLTWPAGFEDRGVETRAGSRVHHLELRGAPALDPAMLGIPSAGMRDVRTTAALWVHDDGAPAGITIELHWAEDAAGSTATATATIDFTFAATAGVERIEVPDGAAIASGAPG